MSDRTNAPVQLSIKVVTPVRADARDLERRADRYRRAAMPGVGIEVVNLAEAPASLACEADVQASESAFEREVMATRSAQFDAIVYDCVLDSVVTRLRRASAVPVFGPTQCTLAFLPQVAERFSIVARTQAHCELMARAVHASGFGSRLRSMHTLGISDEDSRDPAIMARALRPKLQALAGMDAQQAVVMGSTTIDIPDEVRVAFGDLRLFCPGLMALRTVEALWRENVLSGRPQQQQD